jgi:hypothetical protein
LNVWICEIPAKFLEFMHETIKLALRDGVDEVITAEAVQRGAGWMHIQGT